MLITKVKNMFLKLYCDKANAKRTQHDIKKIKITSKANVTTVINPTVVVDTKSGAYGIFDQSDKLVRQSLQYRGKNHNFIPRHVPHNTPYIDSEAIYIGNIYPHFGHFLVEHLNRLWGGEKKQSDIKYIFINNKNLDVKKYLYEFMSAFGVKKKDIIILTQSTRFRKIYIPSQTFNISGAFVDCAMTDGYRLMAKNIKGFGYKKVYMSRTKLPENMKTIGEEKIEKIFAKNGYKIIYPETMTIKEQIASVRDAKYLAGCAGTALHWCLFMKPGGTVITLRRNSKHDTSIRTQYILNNVCDLNSVFVWASIEKHKSEHGGNHAPQIIGVNENLKKFFDEFGFKYNDSDIAFDEQSMDKYTKAYAKYTADHGTYFHKWFFKRLIKYTACLIPGRINRGKYRHYMKSKYL